MKLGYNTKAKDPTYFIQEGYRDSDGRAKTRKVKTIGKHSELLEITDDPLSYARKEVEKFNKDIDSQKVSYEVLVDFSETVEQTQDQASKTTARNIGYLFLQSLMHDLKCRDFFLQQIVYNSGKTIYSLAEVSPAESYKDFLKLCGICVSEHLQPPPLQT